MSCIAELEFVRLRGKVYNKNGGKSSLVNIELSSVGQTEKKNVSKPASSFFTV
jgi:hypothetical protein